MILLFCTVCITLSLLSVTKQSNCDARHRYTLLSGLELKTSSCSFTEFLFRLSPKEHPLWRCEQKLRCHAVTSRGDINDHDELHTA